jgi:diguanylate cyclase (GGDEF)-like protein
MYKLFSFTPERQVMRLEKGWTVTYHNQQYLNTNLESMSDQVGSTFTRGDVIILNHVQPLTDLNVDFPYLFFKTQYCSFDVYLDNELLYSKFQDAALNKVFVGVGYNAIPLPEDYPGKRLMIKLTVIENDTKADISNPMVGEFADLYRVLLHTALYPCLTGCFMVIFGIVFLIISLLFYIRSSGVSNQIFFSLLNIMMGGWMLTAFNILDFLLDSGVATTIEYVCMYLMTPCIYMIVYDLHRRHNNLLANVMGAATILFTAFFITMHFINIVHINHFQRPYYIVSFMGMLLLLAYDYVDIKDKSATTAQRMSMLGLTVLSVSLVLYALVAISRRFADYRQSFILLSLIPTGALFFVVMQLLNYFVFMTHSFAKRKEYQALSKIAYIDNLTGLPNRVSCDEKLVELNKSDDDFCILSMDLNGLKEVNDNSGHPAGDRLLKSFAATLQEVFEGVGSCHRTGGDEFLVLIKEIESDTLDGLLKQLDEKLLELDKTDSEINHSVSYGYAFRHETEEKDTHTVFMLADKRMYDYKRARYAHMMKR